MSDKIKIQITISPTILRKLEEQLEAMKIAEASSEISSLPKIDTVEELIESYIEQLTRANDDFVNMKDKLEEVYQTFEQKGINLSEIFNSLYSSNNKEKEEKTTETKIKSSQNKKS